MKQEKLNEETDLFDFNLTTSTTLSKIVDAVEECLYGEHLNVLNNQYLLGCQQFKENTPLSRLITLLKQRNMRIICILPYFLPRGQYCVSICVVVRIRQTKDGKFRFQILLALESEIFLPKTQRGKLAIRQPVTWFSFTHDKSEILTQSDKLLEKFWKAISVYRK